MTVRGEIAKPRRKTDAGPKGPSAYSCSTSKSGGRAGRRLAATADRRL